MNKSKQRQLNLRHVAQLLTVCDCGHSVSRAAEKLGIAQSVLSRNIQSLERHLGQRLLVRSGRRLVGATPLCDELLHDFREISVRIDNINSIATGRRGRVEGEIRVACTHLQARYVLPEVFAALRQDHPSLSFSIQQDFPARINDLILANHADLGICSEKLCDETSLTSHPAYQWERVVVARPDHPILKRPRLSLAALAREPLVTYIPGITGRGAMDEAFRRAGFEPNIIVAAADSDVIKEFARNGHGVGVIASIAYEEADRGQLGMRRLGRLFPPMGARVVHRRDRLLTPAQEAFVKEFCKASARQAKEAAKRASGGRQA
ncbi:MAG: LysR family transcriptional regulator [Betaproteobacteria bacterium AqS2]|uniref:LysR family transcriptional regulator n=1 Tax=Candidatus Amphirhobacter heronislandensis TaxID=1732024 RepID=A0A930UGG3_9GAMM|nr:LysR family transcriptional regulator [Betaproteobacteria bacterium AqS2]